MPLKQVTLMLIVLMLSCRKDFIAEDIDDKKIAVNAPADNAVTAINAVSFWWEPLYGAESYNLQVVTPSFSTVTRLVADSNLKATRFDLVLEPGNYQWRIRATNGGHTTQYQTFNLKIDTSSSLTGQVINLLAPVNGYLSGKTAVTFSWSALATAKQYQIMINEGSVTSSIVTGTSFTAELPVPSLNTTEFTWKVKGLNDFSVSQFSASRTFTIDRTPPDLSFPLTPTSSASFAQNVTLADTLKWMRPPPSNILLDAKYDSLFVATDSLFTLSQLKVKMRVNGTSVRLNQLIPGLQTSHGGAPYYYWRLNSTDSAGNRSGGYSNFYKFKLVP